MLSQSKTHITSEEYLRLERLAETRSEYYDGEIFNMAGASTDHVRITSNLVISLGTQLRETPCDVFSSDMRVKIEEIGKYTYPDVLIACDKQEYEDEQQDNLLNPVVIIEVLSDSTEAYDRGPKFLHYQSFNSLAEYLLVSQNTARVEKFVRAQHGVWLYSEVHGVDAALSIETMECTVPLSEIYQRVQFTSAH